MGMYVVCCQLAGIILVQMASFSACQSLTSSPSLFKYWTNITDGVTALKQHRITASCFSVIQLIFLFSAISDLVRKSSIIEIGAL